jgi:hypothetical protein
VVADFLFLFIFADFSLLPGTDYADNGYLEKGSTGNDCLVVFPYYNQWNALTGSHSG